MELDTDMDMDTVRKNQMNNKITYLFRLCFVFTLLLISSTALSQNRRGISTFHFSPHYYLGASVGLNAFLADGYSEYGFSDCYGMSQYYQIGYNISEIIGLNINLSYSNHNWPATSANLNHKFTVQKLGVDMMFNLSNYLLMYNLSRKNDLSMGIGTGYLNREKSTFQNEYYGAFLRGIVQYNFRLTNILDLSVKGIVNIANENFNEKVIGRKIDVMPELLIGISYQNRKYGLRRWSN